ncbi:hypothetical protein [Thioclava sp. SK-1]|uniref:hypothetical protein n=1 Tax=Thioclava sp. SK-1 TaxID=1889770 RepID=UPI00159F34B5|nr:hypothetical protein [Thioclava sp. SK-1]
MARGYRKTQKQIPRAVHAGYALGGCLLEPVKMKGFLRVSVRQINPLILLID